MRANTFKMSSIAFSFVVLIASFQNCADKRFAADNGSGSPVKLGLTDNDTPGIVTETDGPNCRQVLNTITVPVKMVFVVDASGSNKKDGDKPGTDPDKTVRGGSIQRFYNTYSGKSNFYWNFVTFAADTAKSLALNANAGVMQTAINTFMGTGDSGHTPYVAALDKAKSAITSDSSRAPHTKYIVVFLSDGQPNPMVSDTNLKNEVRDIVNAVPGQVSFNTIYYGETDPSSSQRLKMMAETGSGNFLDTNANPTGNMFLISDLVVVPGEVCTN